MCYLYFKYNKNILHFEMLLQNTMCKLSEHNILNHRVKTILNFTMPFAMSSVPNAYDTQQMYPSSAGHRGLEYRT